MRRPEVVKGNTGCVSMSASPPAPPSAPSAEYSASEKEKERAVSAAVCGRCWAGVHARVSPGDTSRAGGRCCSWGWSSGDRCGWVTLTLSAAAAGPAALLWDTAALKEETATPAPASDSLRLPVSMSGCTAFAEMRFLVVYVCVCVCVGVSGGRCFCVPRAVRLSVSGLTDGRGASVRSVKGGGVAL